MSEQHLFENQETPKSDQEAAFEAARVREKECEATLESIMQELDMVQRDFSRLQDALASTRHRIDYAQSRREDAARELAAHWKETLEGRQLLFSGIASKSREENGKWSVLDSGVAFESVRGRCIKILNEGDVLDLDSDRQKLVERIKDPAVWVRADDEDYLIPFSQFNNEGVIEEETTKSRIEDPASLQGAGLYAKRDIHVNPEAISEMLEQWEDEREAPHSFTIPEGTVLRIDVVYVNEDDYTETVLEFESFEGGKHMDGLRPQNANARMKLSAIMNSVDSWELVDDIDLIVR